GRKAFAPLDRASHDEIAALLEPLEPDAQRRTVDAMATIASALDRADETAKPSNRRSYVLRNHRPGDIGWVISRHGALYAQEYGWDETFEALVAGIVKKFIEHYDPRKERCWIAEKDGEPVGSVFVVKQSATVAKLRLMLVEPKARGLGIGARLVDECVRFAGQTGYGKITLWTNSVLRAARRIYKEAGFRLIRQERHRSFGHDLVGETWDLKL